jgi:hypothetical protein
VTQGFGLSATARLALLQRLSRKKEEKGPAPGAARAFRELPGQRDMELIREAAGALGLENPFFRPHEGIAGATTVIGGIFVSREQTTNSRTPLLYRIPFLGWLFKNDSQTDTSRELLIFITPRIQKG